MGIRLINENQTLFINHFENTLDAMALIENNVIIDCNEAMVKILGYDYKEDIMNLRPFELSSKHQLDQKLSSDWDNEMISIALEKGNHKFIWTHKLKNEDIFIAEVTLTTNILDDRKIISATVRDITEQYTSKELLKQSEEKYKQIFNNSNDLLIIRELTHDDKPGSIIEVNDVACKTFGHSRDELLKLSDAEVGNVRLSKRLIQKLKREGVIIFEDTHKSTDGTIRDYEVRAHIFILFNKSVVFFIARDITERKKRDRKIEYLAYTDTLTGLKNRNFIIERINILLSDEYINRKDIVVFNLKIENLKRINDTLGTIISDEVLKYFSKELINLSSKEDFISRIDSDQFIIIKSFENKIITIFDFIMNILNVFDNPIQIKNQEIHLNVCIGVLVGLCDNDSRDSNDILRKSNIALNETKKNNGSSFEIYSPLIEKRMNEDFLLEQELSNAIYKNEFKLNYQPIINSFTGEIVSCEALLRWQNPKLGSLSPFKFIPIAEKNGSIIDIGKWVLKTACKQNKEWQEKGYKPISIAVNISVRQLEQKGFIEMIENTLKETRLDVKYLELEITESVYIQNIEDVLVIIEKLRNLGIKWSIDDFGTGYSSLSKLNKLPLDKLKIDRSFINDICEDKNIKSIVPAIIAIAKNLRLKVVAEGVENKKQLQFLQEYNCDLIQGYLFSKPVDKDEFEMLLGKGSSL